MGSSIGTTLHEAQLPSLDVCMWRSRKFKHCLMDRATFLLKKKGLRTWEATVSPPSLTLKQCNLVQLWTVKFSTISTGFTPGLVLLWALPPKQEMLLILFLSHIALIILFIDFALLTDIQGCISESSSQRNYSAIKCSSVFP